MTKIAITIKGNPPMKPAKPVEIEWDNPTIKVANRQKPTKPVIIFTYLGTYAPPFSEILP